MLKDGWVTSFSARLRDLRPELGLNFAHAIALGEWPRNQKLTPEGAAEQWVRSSAKNVVPQKRP